MQEHQVRRVPIVDEDSRLVGIVAQADVATRTNDPKRTAKVVGRISRSNEPQSWGGQPRTGAPEQRLK